MHEGSVDPLYIYLDGPGHGKLVPCVGAVSISFRGLSCFTRHREKNYDLES